jgi:hypothetical protein
MSDRRLLELAEKWSEWHDGDLSTPEAAFEAYLAHRRCRRMSPNPLFHEAWYRERHPDVAQAIEAGRAISGLDHFVSTGVHEGRPFSSYVARRLEWCRTPAPRIESEPGGEPATAPAAELDDESRGFLEAFPHVSAVAYYNAYGRFLGGRPPVGAPPMPAGRRTAILVLGMHRSGTSALSASLVAAGASIGWDLIPSTPANPSGHWESRDIARKHDEILARAGSRWHDWRAVEFPDARTRRDAVRELGELIDRSFRRTPLFAVKDPRSCRLAFLWREALDAAGVDGKVVVPVRHPFEVAASLQARNEFPIAKGLRLWTRHVLDALRQTRGLPRVLVRHGDLLARGPAEIDRIGEALGIRWPVGADERAARIAEFIDPSLRHQRADGAPTIDHPDLPWVERLWSLVNDGNAALERDDLIDEIDREFSRAG